MTSLYVWYSLQSPQPETTPIDASALLYVCVGLFRLTKQAIAICTLYLNHAADTSILVFQSRANLSALVQLQGRETVVLVVAATVYGRSIGLTMDSLIRFRLRAQQSRPHTLPKESNYSFVPFVVVNRKQRKNETPF